MKAAILGLGKTLKFYKPERFDFCVGVNDIARYHNPVDYCVCVDFVHRFTEERKKYIDSTICTKFYSQISEWSHIKGFEKINIRSTVDIDRKNVIKCNNNSTYVAAVMAYKLGAKEIVMYGADFHQDHNYFKNKVAYMHAVSGFKHLKKEMESKGVKLYVGHAYSKLSSVLPLYK